MNGPNSIPSPEAGEPHSGQWREILSDAIRYWEQRRIAYNLILTAVVVIWIVSTWPHFRVALTWSSLLALVVLAMLANVSYCAAYLADIPMQFSCFRELWRRRRWGCGYWECFSRRCWRITGSRTRYIRLCTEAGVRANSPEVLPDERAMVQGVGMVLQTRGLAGLGGADSDDCILFASFHGV